MNGVIKSFSEKNGYGFISSDTDHFFTVREWKELGSPEIGAKVTFDSVKTDKGMRAKKIRRD